MLTTIILCIVVAFIFYKIGIYTVLFMAVSIALKASLALILALSGAMTWRWWRAKRKGKGIQDGSHMTAEPAAL